MTVSRTAIALPVAAILAGALAQPAAAGGETRAFAISWFYVAHHFDPEGRDCPRGFNPKAPEIYRRELTRLGWKPAEVERFINRFLVDYSLIPVVRDRGRIDGRPVNVYHHPTSVPDPKLLVTEGPYGLGFNLDGKDKPGDLIDPETGERGVDNNLYRVLGCVTEYRKQTATSRPQHPQGKWGVMFEQMPAYVIEVSGIDDPLNDEAVTVGLYRSFDHLTTDAAGGAKADMTFRIDPDPRSRNLLRGAIRDGVVTTEPADINLQGDPFWMTAFAWKEARLRLKVAADGTATGILGGYHAWFPIYWQQGNDGWGVEATNNLDVPGFYYSLRRMADAFPDPKTGENTAISTAYEIEAVPAFLIHPEGSSPARTAEAPVAR